jgi:hypothetical protein
MKSIENTNFVGNLTEDTPIIAPISICRRVTVQGAGSGKGQKRAGAWPTKHDLKGYILFRALETFRISERHGHPLR